MDFWGLICMGIIVASVAGMLGLSYGYTTGYADCTAVNKKERPGNGHG